MQINDAMIRKPKVSYVKKARTIENQETKNKNHNQEHTGLQAVISGKFDKVNSALRNMAIYNLIFSHLGNIFISGLDNIY